MEIEPLSKDIYNRAKAAGVETITLNFQGGSDEGFLYIHINPATGALTEEEVEEWAWEQYDYSGAGEGSDYGDNIQYDIKNDTASHTSWYHVEHYDDPTEVELEVEEDAAV